MQAVKNLINSDVGPKLYDRKTKQTGNERISRHMYLRMEVMYSRPMDAIDRSNFVRHKLVTESIDYGHRNNQPESVDQIPEFIEFFETDMTQFKREKPEEYKTFNDFFTREIKEGARPVAEPEDNSIVVSAADSRLVVFDSLEESENLWIKGEKFSFEKLLGHDEALANIFRKGVLANFRLAPQDYHRFHTPVAGRIEHIKTLGGTTYSVEPCAIKSDVDVLGDNERDVIVIDAGENGKVAFVAIGAMAVGRVTTVIKEGDTVKKGDELGYFSFGGSDVVVLFEKFIKWDDDLKEYSKQGIETLITCNQRIGQYQPKGKTEFSG